MGVNQWPSSRSFRDHHVWEQTRAYLHSSTQCQQSWQDWYLCNKPLIKAPVCCASPEGWGCKVGGRMGWCGMQWLMRLCSPDLTANQISMLSAFMEGQEWGWQLLVTHWWAPTLHRTAVTVWPTCMALQLLLESLSPTAHLRQSCNYQRGFWTWEQ